MTERVNEIISLIKELCAIPAPPNHEEKRAQFCRKYLEDLGFENVFIDEAENVILELGLDGESPITVFTAHTDTVFPDTEPFTAVEKDGRLYCPGVGDDTANLAMMLVCIKYLTKEHPELKNLVFAANSGEEGLGNLRGARAIVKRYKERIGAFVSLDGGFESICTEAVGSLRYKVKVKTEGGHSFGNFGNRNAIAVAASFINSVYSVKVPEKRGTVTTYNVGTISGGTSVNTIAQNAEFLLECRSSDAECLLKMKTIFENLAAAYDATVKNKEGNSVELELVGERPGSDIETGKERITAEKYAAVLKRYTGKNPPFRSGSTDCNIPLSMGIPAVCFGGYSGEGAHTREEFIELSSLETGYKVVSDSILESQKA